MANGGFEDGLTGWEFDGEVKLRYGDLGGGRYAAMLLGRNSVAAELSQSVDVPTDASSLYVVYWWRSVSSEPLAATKPYDTLDVLVRPSTGSVLALETISNLAERDEWLPSGYDLTGSSGTIEIAFEAETNPRDPTEVYLDQVRLLACTGGPVAYPQVVVDPPSGGPDTAFLATTTGLMPTESTTAWILDPNRLRFDIGTIAASGEGTARHAFTTESSWAPGAFAAASIGHDGELPGSGEFTINAASAAQARAPWHVRSAGSGAYLE